MYERFKSYFHIKFGSSFERNKILDFLQCNIFLFYSKLYKMYLSTCISWNVIFPSLFESQLLNFLSTSSGPRKSFLRNKKNILYRVVQIKVYDRVYSFFIQTAEKVLRESKRSQKLDLNKRLPKTNTKDFLRKFRF